MISPGSLPITHSHMNKFLVVTVFLCRYHSTGSLCSPHLSSENGRCSGDTAIYMYQFETGVICGVDEAGRGPVLGPLVVAAVMVDDDKELRRLKVKDSKQLTRQKREELAPLIRKIARVEVAVVTADEIDSFRDDASLNVLEAHLFASLIERLRPDEAYIDSADVVPRRFSLMIKRQITCSPIMVCEHNADVTYPVVSAASIIAKTVRDKLVLEIQKEFSRPIGSGYAHDKVTVGFLHDWIKEHGSFPPHTRKSWRTAKEIYAMTRLTKLTEWVDEDDCQTED